MDSTHRTVTNPEPSPELKPPAAAAVTLPQEATGDSGDSDADVSVRTAGQSSEPEEDDDAESCSGGGGGFSGGCFIDSAAKDDECDEFEDDATVEVDMTEVDSKMAVPWWRRTGEYAAKGDGGCAPAAAAEGGRKLAAGGGHAVAESNRLFWEACIAHGY